MATCSCPPVHQQKRDIYNWIAVSMGPSGLALLQSGCYLQFYQQDSLFPLWVLSCPDKGTISERLHGEPGNANNSLWGDTLTSPMDREVTCNTFQDLPKTLFMSKRTLLLSDPGARKFWRQGYSELLHFFFFKSKCAPAQNYLLISQQKPSRSFLILNHKVSQLGKCIETVEGSLRNYGPQTKPNPVSIYM